jgi:protease-4
MGSFFRMFFASLLALVIFALIGVFLLVGTLGALASKEKPEVANKSVLTLDLSQHFTERKQDNSIAALATGEESQPGLYDVVRIIKHAKEDDKIKGLYIIANGNGNAYASSEELRNAILDFKNSKKFVIAYGDVITENAYYVASAAHKVYANPVGAVEWDGFSVDMPFIKGTLEKLNIQPQIFYAGKFKSATEPLRATQMTPENKLQTIEWLGDLYNNFLVKTAQARNIDTATLLRLANTGAIQESKDAVTHKLIDALKYDDEVKEEMKKNLGLGKYDKLNLTPINTYAEAISYKQTGSNRIALILAEGNIVDGEGDNSSIGGDAYVKMIRKVRLDKSIKAIVLRVNSGGGSALASEKIWRELELAKADKPVVVSFGDVAASGGYYIAAGADSIFAQPNTITGSIGVFTIIPNMAGFFNDKLGVTFDGVKTATYADASISRALTPAEQQFMQAGVDRIYLQFKQRVAQGRKKDINYIDSIAQGRVWSGEDALRNGLVDKIGSLQAAIDCAARLAKVKEYRLREFPEAGNWLDELLNKKKDQPAAMIRKQLGEENYKIYQEMLRVKEVSGSAQARLPFQFIIH